MNHILIGTFAKMHPVSPETGNPHQDLNTITVDITFIAGIRRVLINRERNCTITMDFFKCDLPLVVTLDAIKGHHWEQSTGQSLLLCIMIRTR